MKFLRCKLYVGPFSALHWDLFKHGASSHLHPVTTTKCKLHFLSTTESLAVSRIHVARKSSESFPGKLNIKPKAENVTAVHNRTVSKVNDGKTKKHGLKSKAAMSTEIPPKGKMNATKKFDDYNEHADQMLFGNSEVYTRKKLIEIYQQKLLFQASRRIATGKVKALKVDTDTSVKNMKRIFFATNFRHNLQDNKLVLEEDIQRTAIYLENAAKRNSKYPPFDKVLLTKAAKVLNEELLGSAERKSLLYCARNVDRIDRSFETAKIGTQICIMSNKLPLALPIITSAFRKRLILIEKIRSVDASFDCSNLKSDKYQQMFCMFFKHAVLSDPRASYVDWAMEMLSRDQMTPSLEFLVSSLTLLDKCDQKSTHGKALIGHLLGHEKEVLENIEGFSIGDLRYFFKNILQRLAVKYETPVPTDNVVPVFEDATMNHAFRRYSMLQPDDNCLPLSREKIPPQFKLSDILTYDELIDNYQRQLQYENLVNVPVTSIEAVDLDMECSKNSKGKNKKIRFFHKGKELDGHNMKEIDDILKDWHRKMLDEIVEALHSQKRGNLFDKDLYEIFQVIDLKALIDHLIDIALTIGANEMAMPHFQINSLIGQFLFNSFYQQFLTRTRYMEKLDKIYPEYAKIFFDEKKTLQVCAREEWIKLQNKYSHMGPGIHDFPSMWPSHSCHYLCKLLITILLKHCQVPTNVAEKYSLRGFENDQNVGVKNSRWKSLPCLSFRYITHNAGKTRVSARTHLTVYPHLFFTMMARATNRSEIKMLATAIPTLVPPVPICSQNHGGYLVSPSQFLRLGVTNETDSLSKDAVLKKIFVNHPDMDGIYDSVYTFSSVPWKINRQVFDIVSYLFKSGGDLELDIPLDENKMRLHLEKSSSNSTSKTDEIQLFKRAKELKQAENNNYGLRMSLLYQLSIAERMKNEKAFWFPSNMDFRGRCYDIPPVFNHIGDDKTRSLLMFAQGKPLGDSGFMWLKLQLASLSGNCKKMSYADRIQYVDLHMELILDSAAKPLSGFKWWTTLDEPFQCLACCFEISNAIKSGDVTKFVSHLPIHQDGSCNGLQHYAALGRDSEGNAYIFVEASRGCLLELLTFRETCR